MSDRDSFTTEEMQAYWKSEEWTKMKADLFALRGGRCERCGKTLDSTFVPHHLSYDHFKEETAEDLQLLCMRCHAEVHKKVELKLTKGQKRSIKRDAAKRRKAEKKKTISAAKSYADARYQQSLAFIAMIGSEDLNGRAQVMDRDQVIALAFRLRRRADSLAGQGVFSWDSLSGH